MNRRASRQAGWAGLLAFLLAMLAASVVVAVMLRGSLGGKPSAPASAPAVSEETAGAQSAPRQAVERARALQEEVNRQADDLEKRIDSEVK